MQLALFSFALLASGATVVEELTQRQAEFSTLIGAVTSVNVTSALEGPGPFTLFAPTNAAFTALFASLPNASSTDPALLTAVLSYHLVPGQAFEPPKAPGKVILETALTTAGPGLNQLPSGGQRVVVTVGDNHVSVNLANVTDTIKADNGIIHVIDAVLVPPRPVSETAAAANLTALVEALKAANLVSTVDGLKGITVFAPLNAAFAALTSVPPVEQLKNILTFHVVPKVIYSTDIPAGNQTLTLPSALTGENITVVVAGDKVTLKGAGNASPVNVVLTDVLVDSGVVHVIDGILLPSQSGLTSTNNGNSGTNGNTRGTSGALKMVSGFALLAVVALF